MGVDPNQGAPSNTASLVAQRPAGSWSSSSSSNAPIKQSRKRKGKVQTEAAEQGYDEEQDVEQPPVKPKKVKRDPAEEKRLRRFRSKATSAFEAVYERATTQRFFVLSRIDCGTPDCPEAFFEISGSTGNIYNVTIARQPTCDCPHANAGNQCKHTLFVMKKVLRAKYEYVYQLALLSSELRDIFAAAPRPVENAKEGSGDEDKNRKPVDGDCPICFEEMESGAGKEPLVWCKAACGQNIHKQCFDMWASTKRGTGKITCPYCRSNWEMDAEAGVVDVANIKRGGVLNKDGYVNIADQLGISTQRDFSTYSRFWSGHPDAYRRRRPEDF